MKNLASLQLLLTAAGAMAAGGCGPWADKLSCGDLSCDWTDTEWQMLSSLADLPPTPPPDPSNRYVGVAAAEALGHKLFFDPRFSGSSLLTDALRRPVAYGRAPRGEPIAVSCASCHNLDRAGIDTESFPGNVSIGASWGDTNALSVVNSAYYGIVHWNGRADSLWALSMAVVEGGPMNGSRLQTAWLLQDKYRETYQAIFEGAPLPETATLDEVRALVETEGARVGQCKLTPGCPVDRGCRVVQDEAMTATGCFPRFPLRGKPGSKPGCQPGDAAEPHGDAYDCMAKDDQLVVTRTLVNYGKAIAAYEFRLVSRDSAFDDYVRAVREGAPPPAQFSGSAQRGARLFVGKAACIECHSTPLFSDSGFHNVGISSVGPGVPTEADCRAGGVCDCVGAPPDRGPSNCLPWGAFDGVTKLKKAWSRRDSSWSDDPTDLSRQAFYDMDPGQLRKGSWRTPTLRNVAVTGPYMHNGSMRSLEEVVDHYNAGGATSAPGDRSPQMRPLFLTPAERSDLVEFLRALTGPPLPAELSAKPELP